MLTILIIIFLFVLAISSDYFIATVLTGLTAIFVYYTVENRELKYTTVETEIYSIGSSHAAISGSFVIGSGTIKSIPQYSYFVKKDGVIFKEHIPSEGTAIIETDSIKPKIVSTYCTPGQRTTWDFNPKNSGSMRCDKREEHILYIPTNSIIQTFNIQ